MPFNNCINLTIFDFFCNYTTFLWITKINRQNFYQDFRDWTNNGIQWSLSTYTSIPSVFKKPIVSERMTAFFGDRRIYAYTNGKSSTSLHYGDDYGVPTGTEVFACGDGKVVMAENRISTGYSIVIEHLPGLYSLYYHLNEMSVKEGDIVKQGQLIAKSGSTGLATGPHLHWEIRLNGSAIRPNFFLSDFAFEEE